MTTVEVSYEIDATREFYDRQYSCFAAVPGFSMEAARTGATFRLLFDRLHLDTSERSLIDLGCGLGLKTYILARSFRAARGVDISPRAIQIATLLNDNPALRFEVSDLDEGAESGRYDVVTALGLSVFNVSRSDDYVREVARIADRYMHADGAMIIGSATDHSGTAPTGWFLHSAGQLREIRARLERIGLSAMLVFPHRQPGFYTRSGLAAVGVELFQCARSRRRRYFWVLRRIRGTSRRSPGR